jgi:cell division septal protein FtsQ
VVWRRVGALIAGAALLVALAVWLLTSPRLGVTCVEVMGARSVPNSLIVWRAGIPEGANIVRLRPSRVARRVASLPAIRSVKVSRRLPHTVTIQVRERTPALFVRRPQGLLYMDQDGVCFEGNGEDALPAVELVGIPLGRFAPGSRLVDDRLPAALDLIARAGRAGLPPRRLAVGSAGEMDLVLSSGATLKLGEFTQLAEKIDRAKVALQALKKRGPVEYLDVSCLDAMVWKPAEGPPAAEARAPAAKAVP